MQTSTKMYPQAFYNFNSCFPRLQLQASDSIPQNYIVRHHILSSFKTSLYWESQNKNDPTSLPLHFSCFTSSVPSDIQSVLISFNFIRYSGWRGYSGFIFLRNGCHLTVCDAKKSALGKEIFDFHNSIKQTPFIEKFFSNCQIIIIRG